MIKYILLLSIGLILLSISCRKSDPLGDPTESCLATGTWKLISSTTTNPSIQRYQGIKSDSLRITWKWASNGNFLLDSIYSYIAGSNNKYSVTFSFGLSSLQYGYQDTLKCYPAWKPDFSNNILIKSINNDCNLVVFSITSLDGKFVEIDSLGR